MKSRFYTLLIALLASAAVNLLSSCSHKAAAPKTSGPVPSEDQGTSDSGGGTGLDGKVFESYIVDPLKLPSYQQYLKPMLDNIIAANKDEPTKYADLFKAKTWFIAPVQLDKIKKETLGVSFFHNETQQIARQTQTEVWISKAIFDKMSGQEQADILLHELVMNFYFLRFLSFSEVCKLSTLVDPGKDNNCTPNSDLLEKAMPGEPWRVLNEEDNSNIRFVTSWIKQNATKPVQETDFLRVMVVKGFDKRFFNPANYDGKDHGDADSKFKAEEIIEAVTSATLTDHMPSQCTTSSNGATKPCSVLIEKTAINFAGVPFPALRVRVVLDGKEIASVQALLGTEDVSLSANSDPVAGVLYSLPLVDWRDKVRVGDRMHSGFLLFSKEAPNDQLTLNSAIMKAGVVVSIDKSKDIKCALREPKVTSPADDTLIIRREGKAGSITESMLSGATPFAACNESTVAE